MVYHLINAPGGSVGTIATRQGLTLVEFLARPNTPPVVVRGDARIDLGYLAPGAALVASEIFATRRPGWRPPADD